jgi:hypothetical protein
MPTATQLPYLREPAARTGRRLFRKQVLPIGTVTHPQHGPLHFTADRLAKLRESFLAGAMDQTPFALVDGQNRHSDSPDNYRGEVKGLELTDEGLFATIEATDSGAKLLDDNPRLPVSVRIKKLDDGREVLAHVAATHDPVAKGMRPWEAIDASDTTTVQDFSDGGVYDALSMDPTAPPPQDPTTAADALSTEEVGKFRAFLNRLSGTPAEPQTPAAPAATAPADPAQTLTDADVDALLAGVADPAVEPAEPGKEPAMALSEEDRRTIDLANQSNLRYGTSQITSRLDAYVTAGVPPALVNAARAQLVGDTDEHKAMAMDFANGREPAPVKALFATLDAAKGTIDFSERGSDLARIDSEDDRMKQMQKDADELAARYI